jgi:pimeloyl-ACP methyl ester carboxylesterase
LRDDDADHPTHVTSFDCGDRFHTTRIGHASLLTNALVFPSRFAPPRTRLLLVPGNPGVCEFYFDFADALHRLLNGSAEIIVVSHLGHCGRATAGVALSLDDQVAHKRHLLRALLGESDDAARVFRDFGLPLAHAALPLLLAGHSIGAFVCFKLLAERDATCRRVPRVIALMPTFRNLYDGLAPFVRVAVLPGVRHVFAALLGYMPSGVTRWLMHYSHGMSDESKYATADKLCYDFVNNVLYMAHCETLQGHRPSPATSRSCLPTTPPAGRLYFLYSPIDPYTPLSFVDDLRREHPHLDARIVMTSDRVRHAFVLSNSSDVAELLVSSAWLD